MSMDESIFGPAVSAILAGEYCESDVKVLKEELGSLNKRELAIKRQMEKSKNEFVKNKDKFNNELKYVRREIKNLKNILKTI